MNIHKTTIWFWKKILLCRVEKWGSEMDFWFHSHPDVYYELDVYGYQIPVIFLGFLFALLGFAMILFFA